MNPWEEHAYIFLVTLCCLLIVNIVVLLILSDYFTTGIFMLLRRLVAASVQQLLESPCLYLLSYANGLRCPIPFLPKCTSFWIFVLNQWFFRRQSSFWIFLLLPCCVRWLASSNNSLINSVVNSIYASSERGKLLRCCCRNWSCVIKSLCLVTSLKNFS